MKQIKQQDNSFIGPLTKEWHTFLSRQALEPDVVYLQNKQCHNI